MIHDGDDPYFVVAADKGTATFSDIANALALERNFWLGDAFASGGSHGYDHKAMGITAKGAWISVQRHFLEMGIDVQSRPGDRRRLRRHVGRRVRQRNAAVEVDPAARRVRSSPHLHRSRSRPGEELGRAQAAVRAAALELGRLRPQTAVEGRRHLFARREVDPAQFAKRARCSESTGPVDPATLINAILKSPVDLLWFGGIGTYIKASTQSQTDVGDPFERCTSGERRRACARKVIGEGANLGVTQAGRIEFAEHGGRINTDFIDNSAGVDCSDNEVNIKIPLNREMRDGRLSFDKRNKLLARMTDDVAELVLEDNRLQSLALSIAEAGGAKALPGYVRTIELLEASGRLDRKVEGLASTRGPASAGPRKAAG